MSAWASSPTESKRATVRRRNAALFTFGLLGTGVGAPALAQGTDAHARDTGVVVTRDVMVPMRDGIRLATDVYRPRADGGAATEKLPTILIRTPYDKGFDPYALGPSWGGHGYAVVVQDTRGRYKSERASRLPPSTAAAAGDDAAPAGARIRRVAGASHGPRRERRLLGSKRHHRSRRPLQGHPGLPDRRMVRLVGGEHRCELRRAESTPQESGLSHHGPLDPRFAGPV